jgi:hypothetical protein
LWWLRGCPLVQPPPADPEWWLGSLCSGGLGEAAGLDPIRLWCGGGIRTHLLLTAREAVAMMKSTSGPGGFPLHVQVAGSERIWKFDRRFPTLW